RSDLRFAVFSNVRLMPPITGTLRRSTTTSASEHDLEEGHWLGGGYSDRRVAWQLPDKHVSRCALKNIGKPRRSDQTCSLLGRKPLSPALGPLGPFPQLSFD